VGSLTYSDEERRKLAKEVRVRMCSVEVGYYGGSSITPGASRLDVCGGGGGDGGGVPVAEVQMPRVW